MYSFDARIRYSECDETGRLSLFSMINYLQDCSTFQSQRLGMGIASLDDRGLAWVLANWAIEVDELPRFGTPVTVSTWCYELTRAHALRNFRIEDAAGRPIVRADSQWFVFDTSTGHATRVPEDQSAYVSEEPRQDMAPLARRIPVAEPATPGRSHVVTRFDLDTNHHVNNARYVRFAQVAIDSLGLEMPAPPMRIQVQYRSMALLGDVVTPLVHPCDNGWDVDLRADDGTTYALVRLQSI